MCFLIAAVALAIALFTGAFLAPRPGNHRGVDPYALPDGGIIRDDDGRPVRMTKSPTQWMPMLASTVRATAR
jgi:hypothetical protein